MSKPKTLSNRRYNRSWIHNRGERHQIDSTWELLLHFHRHAQCEPGLAAAADARKGQQPHALAAKQLLHARQLLLSPGERTAYGRQRKRRGQTSPYRG